MLHRGAGALSAKLTEGAFGATTGPDRPAAHWTRHGEAAMLHR